MADEGDRGSAREEEWRADALARWRRGVTTTGGTGRTRCVACDEPIPAARQAAVPGVKRCVGCQTDLEHTEG